MGRPKQDGSPTADARIEEAFFDVLETTSFNKITVSAITKAAGVNRNSFYYHFSGLDELAYSAVSNLLLPEIPRLLASGFGPDSERIDEFFKEATAGTGSLRRMPIVMGAHSTTDLRNMLKSAVFDLWLEAFGLEAAELDHATSTTMEFALGGMFEILSKLPPHADILTESAKLRRLPIIQSTLRFVMATLTAASRD